MKRPSFQFYPGDWSANPNLKRCSFAEKGIWLEVMCLMHDQAEYGVLRWPLREIAEAVKCRAADLHALQRKGVLKGSDSALDEPYIYVPRSGRKDGEPVTLVDTQAGPIWYSSRMVKDEYVRTIRGESAGNGDAPKTPPKKAPDASPKPPIGEAFGPRDAGTPAAPSSSSSSSPSGENPSKLSLASASPPEKPPPLTLVGEPEASPPDCPHLAVLALWAEVLPTMPQHMPSQWRGARADHLRARWRETATEKGWRTTADGLAYLRRFFAYVGRSPFLTGRESAQGKRPFFVELEWLVKPANWAKAHEGKYHPEKAA